jgi:tyrosine-protein kinase Etk/Wzc
MERRPMPPSLRPLLTSWRQICLFTLAVGAAFAAYAFLAPKWYESELVVVPGTPTKPTFGLAAAAAADLPLDLGLSGSDAQRIQAVLKSRSVTDAVIEKFLLTSRYDQSFIEATREELWRHCTTKLDKHANTVSVTCEDKDPSVAQAMTEYFSEVGNRVFRRISASAAAEEVAFLSKRVSEAKHDVDEASARLRDFEKAHNIVDLPEQSKAVVSAISSLKADELSKELELGYLNSFSSSDESTAVQLKKQLSVMAAKMRVLATGPTEGKPSKAPNYDETGMFPPASTVPEARYQFGQLFREQKIQEAVYLLLNQRYEVAKADAARETSTFQVLDAPVRATHKSRPKRAKLILIGLVLGMLGGCGWALGRERLGVHPTSPPRA